MQDFTLANDKKPKVEQQGGDTDDSLFYEMTDFDNIEEREESVFYGLSLKMKDLLSICNKRENEIQSPT